MILITLSNFLIELINSSSIVAASKQYWTLYDLFYIIKLYNHLFCIFYCFNLCFSIIVYCILYICRFMVNRRIFVVGFGLYGSIHGPTEYLVNIEVDLSPFMFDSFKVVYIKCYTEFCNNCSDIAYLIRNLYLCRI